MSTTNNASPPLARREEDRVVYAGVAPPGWKPEVVRQAESSTEALLDPPVAVPDPYGWMRDDTRTSETVLGYLKQENEYTSQMTAHLEPFRQALYQELLSAVQETDYTTPRPRQNYYYYTRTVEGKAYTIYCRAPKPTAKSGPLVVTWDGTADKPVLPEEQVTLDVNELAKGHEYCDLGSVKPSPSQQLLAFAADFNGDETCLMFVKNIATGEVVDHDEKLVVSGSLQWGMDDNTLFYFTVNDVKRPYRMYRRRLDQLTSNADTQHSDELLFEELDDLYWCGMYKSLDGKYLFVESSSAESSEIFYLDLSDPTAKLQCIAKRRQKVLYEVEHRNGQFWIQSNVGGLKNMALFTAPAQAHCEKEWKLVTDANGQALFAGGTDRSLSGLSCFQNHVVAEGREGGLPRVWILRVDEQDAVHSFEQLTFPEPSHDVGMGTHYEFDTDKIVVTYDSMVTPTQSLEIDLHDTSKRTVLKERTVPGYDKSLYTSERFSVKSRDGSVDIPVSLVCRKDVLEQHQASGQPIPVYLYGYGSYGICTEPDFVAGRLPLLNRGMACVVAHIRGGAEMGRQWYEEPNGAKYLCKKNTFNDFVDVARWLVEERKLTAPDVLVCHGRSAGGLLIGASINQAPELFKVALMDVPFVDLVCTMIDASIPLTTHEWEEWGNPNEKKFFQYMMEYSPPQNVKAGAKYPACFMTCGFNDPRVPYWEATKLAAALRHASAPESGPVCVKAELMEGHFSASDRYKHLRETAFRLAFMFDQIGLKDKA